MDPLTAFSLACGVVQLVDFSTKALRKCRQIYQDGALAEYEDIEDLTKQLTDLRIGLHLPRIGQSSQDIEMDSERTLLEVAENCSTTAEQLVKKLRTLKVEGPRGKRQAILKTVKALREKREIHDIQKRLDGFRNAFETQIMINLRSCRAVNESKLADLGLSRQRLNVISLQQSQEFGNLDRKVQELITGLSQGPRSFEELIELTRHGNEQTRNHIDHAFQKHRGQMEEEVYRERLLDSLWFDKIHSREETVADAHRGTFEWIFDKPNEAVRLYDDFVHWLESSQSTYWINGKAGSGKSTLMSFLCQDDRTMESLRIWSKGKAVLMPKFFFWSSGELMEKSTEGLLRSLIWQIFQAVPGFFHTGWKSDALHGRDTIPAWTERRLRMLLQDTIRQVSSSYRLCFFIDGLDEFHGDEEEMINVLQSTVQSTEVKVCLSSRPHRAFDQAFGSSPKLRLQDLTHKDIQNFVVDRFQGMPQVHSISLQHTHWLDEVTMNILARAEGVFLWVALAVKDQVHGLTNNDSPEQLEERLNCLPDKVEGIYARMLKQIEKPYRREAAQFLQITLHGYMVSILDFVLASRGRLDDMLGSPDRIPELELVATSQSTRNRIITTCAGLLEIHDKSEVERPQLVSRSGSSSPWFNFQGEATVEGVFDLESKATVAFVHRTVFDFLEDPLQGGRFLEANTPPEFDASISYAKVKLAKIRLFGFRTELDPLDDIMNTIWAAENKTGMAQVTVCDLLDDIMRRIDQKCMEGRTDSHWSSRESLLIHDPLPLRSEASSGSSSDASFHSASSQPKSDYESLRVLKPIPSFLAFAAIYGLSRYVQQTLDCRKAPLEIDEVDYLLYCSGVSIDTGVQSVERRLAGLNLTEAILGRGGNPNLEIPGPYTSTIWLSFLLGLHSFMHQCGTFVGSGLGQAQPAELRKAYMRITLAFLDNGADLHAIWAIRETSELSGPNHCMRRRYKYVFEIHLNALAVIESSLSDQTQVSHVRQICNAKGIPSYSRCTSSFADVASKDSDESSVETLYDGSVDISEEESSAFLELFKQVSTWPLAREQYMRNIVKSGGEIRRNRLQSSSRYPI